MVGGGLGAGCWKERGEWEPLLSFSWDLSGRGSSVTKSHGRIGPTASGSQASASSLPPRGSQPPGAIPSLSGLPLLAHPWGTLIWDSSWSGNGSKTNLLQRHVVSGGRAGFPWCLDRGQGRGGRWAVPRGSSASVHAMGPHALSSQPRMTHPPSPIKRSQAAAPGVSSPTFPSRIYSEFSSNQQGLGGGSVVGETREGVDAAPEANTQLPSFLVSCQPPGQRRADVRTNTLKCALPRTWASSNIYPPPPSVKRALGPFAGALAEIPEQKWVGQLLVTQAPAGLRQSALPLADANSQQPRQTCVLCGRLCLGSQMCPW